jgi:hypothetical protein
MTTEGLPEHVQRNRAEWDSWAADWADRGARDWAREEISWGELHVLDTDIQASLPMWPAAM